MPDRRGLSPLTAIIDKREKMIAYQLIDSLIGYVVVRQDEIRVEIRRRKDDGWLASFFVNLDDIVTFDSVGAEMTVAEIYLGINFK